MSRDLKGDSTSSNEKTSKSVDYFVSTKALTEDQHRLDGQGASNGYDLLHNRRTYQQNTNNSVTCDEKLATQPSPEKCTCLAQGDHNESTSTPSDVTRTRKAHNPKSRNSVSCTENGQDASTVTNRSLPPIKSTGRLGICNKELMERLADDGIITSSLKMKVVKPSTHKVGGNGNSRYSRHGAAFSATVKLSNIGDSFWSDQKAHDARLHPGTCPKAESGNSAFSDNKSGYQPPLYDMMNSEKSRFVADSNCKGDARSFTKSKIDYLLPVNDIDVGNVNCTLEKRRDVDKQAKSSSLRKRRNPDCT